MNVSGSRILILGLAREGVVLARFFARNGASVTVTDSAPPDRLQQQVRAVGDGSVRYVLGEHHPELVRATDRFFVSPGVPDSNPVYAAAMTAGLAVESMTTLFFEMCPAPIVGVTGSSGKTTTTGLIGHILHHGGIETAVGGNIGDPMLGLLPRIRRNSIVVLELSSFQLSILRQSPQVAVVTNITPNHLDRHGTMDDYIGAKRHIVTHQKPGDHAILNRADTEVTQFAEYTPAMIHWFGYGGGFADGATVLDGQVGLERAHTFVPMMLTRDIPLLGRHNAENVLAALATTALFGVDLERAVEAVRSFRPAPHRLQTVAEIDGVRFVDDSIATSPARATVALEAIDAPVLLIAGGRDKNLPWDQFARCAARTVRLLYLIGEAAPLIEDAVLRHIESESCTLTPDAVRRCSSLQEAVCLARAGARPGDVVLLAPGCTSYDMFTDYRERGEAFARAVEDLKHAA